MGQVLLFLGGGAGGLLSLYAFVSIWSIWPGMGYWAAANFFISLVVVGSKINSHLDGVGLIGGTVIGALGTYLLLA